MSRGDGEAGPNPVYPHVDPWPIQNNYGTVTGTMVLTKKKSANGDREVSDESECRLSVTLSNSSASFPEPCRSRSKAKAQNQSDTSRPPRPPRAAIEARKPPSISGLASEGRRCTPTDASGCDGGDRGWYAIGSDLPNHPCVGEPKERKPTKRKHEEQGTLSIAPDSSYLMII